MDAIEIRAKRFDISAKVAFINPRADLGCCRSTLWPLRAHLYINGLDA